MNKEQETTPVKVKVDPNLRVQWKLGKDSWNTHANMRPEVPCGGCVSGQLKRKAEDGTVSILTHEDCQGTGFRENKKFGRPFKAASRRGLVSSWKSNAKGKK